MRYYGVIIVEGGTSLARKKKLRKIPYDLVSYIQIETETIEDADDKMMILSFLNTISLSVLLRKR